VSLLTDFPSAHFYNFVAHPGGEQVLHRPRLEPPPVYTLNPKLDA